MDNPSPLRLYEVTDELSNLVCCVSSAKSNLFGTSRRCASGSERSNERSCVAADPGQACSGGWSLNLGCEVEQSAVQRSRNVGGVDVVLVLFRLVTFEALFDRIRDQWFLWITARPGLEGPASRRGILLLVL